MGRAKMRNKPSGPEEVSWVRFVCTLVTCTRAPATTAWERSLTMPEMDPVVSARSTLELKSVARRTREAEDRTLNRRCINSSHDPIENWQTISQKQTLNQANICNFPSNQTF